jgi:hypothetical protein
MSGNPLQRIKDRDVLKGDDVLDAIRELAARVEALEGNDKVTEKPEPKPVKKAAPKKVAP